MYTRVQTNIESILRELSGPHPLCRVVDIVSKLYIWSRGAKAILLDNQPALQVTGSRRTVIVLLQPYCTLAFTSTHNCPVPLVCTRWKFSENEEQTSLNGTLLRQIYISLVLRTVTHLQSTEKQDFMHSSTVHRGNNASIRTG